MQILPFVFSLIIVFFFLIARLNSSDALDRIVNSAIYNRHKARLELVKKGSAYNLRSLRAPRKCDHTNKACMFKPPVYRPMRVTENFHKFSLGFLFKNIDAVSLMFAKNELFYVLSSVYQDLMTQEFYEDLLESVIKKQPKRLCNLELSSKAHQNIFYKLLTHPEYPLEDVLTTDVFKDNALCYFFFLNYDLFCRLFASSVLKDYFHKEWQVRKEKKSKVLVKETVQPFLLELCPKWSSVYTDQLLSFQSPVETHLKVKDKPGSREFFYCPISEQSPK